MSMAVTRRGWLFSWSALPAALQAGPDMVRIPGGRFRMGLDEAEIDREFPGASGGMRRMLLTGTPAHEVTLPPFLMDRNEVSNSRFQRFVEARPEWRKERVGGSYLSHWDGNHHPAGQGNLPVVFVTWDAAVAYADWIGQRLPTEAEWEFAARGGKAGARYPWGEAEPTPEAVNFGRSGKGAPAPVGSYPANPYGLHDLAGNVWEFCLDPWSSYSPAAAIQTPESPKTMRATPADRRVIRGGSFEGGAFNLRVTSRDSHRAANAVAHVGFRCARSG